MISIADMDTVENDVGKRKSQGNFHCQCDFMMIICILFCRHRIKFMDYNQLIFTEQHFYSNGHGFNRNTKFTIIKRNEKDGFENIRG